MITDKGKEIISKFLLGQTPAYATHISIGCGGDRMVRDELVLDQPAYVVAEDNISKPLDAGDPVPVTSDLAKKTYMDFEMSRVPITSKGFVDDNEVSKLSFTAELPKENRYDITEIGLWSSGSNSLAKNFDSRIVFNFSEPWQAHSTSISEIPLPGSFILGSEGDIDPKNLNGVPINLKYFRALTDNTIFSYPDRKSRKEGPRFLDSKIFLRGDSSIIQGATGSWSGDNPIYSVTNKQKGSGTATLTIGTHLLNVGDSVVVSISDANFDGTYTITARTNTTIGYVSAGTVASAAATGTVVFEESTHIHLNAINFDISKNSPADPLLLAFSLIDADGIGLGIPPDYVKILVEFYRNETSISSGFAKAEIYIDGSEFSGSRYKVVEIPISDLITSADFTSQQVRVARIFASVVHTQSGQTKTSPSHYIELEGIRLENKTTPNPLYGMAGYSVVRTTDGQPIYKYQNTNNYIEFRFSLDVG